MTTPYHAKYYAAELMKRCSSHQLGKLNQSIFNATVDLNPHQIPHYAPGAGKPVFDDGNMFTVTVPITGEASQGATATGQVAEEVSLQRNILTEIALDALAKSFNTATGQVTGQVAAQVLQACQTPRKATDIQSLLGIKHRETFLNNYLNPLLASGWIERTIPDKPRSRNQKYRLTEKGRKMLKKRT